MHHVPDVAVKAEKAYIKRVQSTWDFLSMAIQIISAAGESITAPQPPPSNPASAPVPKLLLQQQDLCYVPQISKWRCRRGNTSAATEQSLKGD